MPDEAQELSKGAGMGPVTSQVTSGAGFSPLIRPVFAYITHASRRTNSPQYFKIYEHINEKLMYLKFYWDLWFMKSAEWVTKMWPVSAFFINKKRKAAIELTSFCQDFFLNSYSFIERITFIQHQTSKTTFYFVQNSLDSFHSWNTKIYL